MRCAVCGRDSAGVTHHVTAAGHRYGSACPGECAGLLWEAHFDRATNAAADQHALTLWRWRRRRADVEGRVFLEPPPLSSNDVARQRVALERGWHASA